MSAPNPHCYLRAELSPRLLNSSQARSQVRGLSYFLGVPFVHGVAYVLSTHELVEHVRHSEYLLSVLRRADAEGLAAYTADVERLTPPPAAAPAPVECRPGVCVYPGEHTLPRMNDARCREAFPDNWPQAPEPPAHLEWFRENPSAPGSTVAPTT